MKHTLIIAEAGVNHNGSLDLAKQLVDKAVDAGVDYISVGALTHSVKCLDLSLKAKLI